MTIPLRWVLFVTIAVACGAAVPAGAAHQTVNCEDSRAFVLPTMVDPDHADCTFSLVCPSNAGHVCRWTMTAQSFGGHGLVSARLSGPNGLVVSCSGQDSCTKQVTGFTLPPNSSIGMTCRDGDGDLSVGAEINCAATAT